MRFLISIFILTVLACQPRDTPPGDTGTQVRDSAGIQNHRKRAAAGWLTPAVADQRRAGRHNRPG